MFSTAPLCVVEVHKMSSLSAFLWETMSPTTCEPDNYLKHPYGVALRPYAIQEFPFMLDFQAVLVRI